MYHYRNILFDLDGTVIDSKAGVMDSLKKAFDELHLTLPPEEQLNGFMGPPLEECFTQVCGLSWEEAVRAITVYRRYYRSEGLYNVTVYEGVRELLTSLRNDGLSLGVATSKNQNFAHIVLNHCGIAGCFDSIAGAPDDMETPWSKKDSILKAMRELKAGREETVLIGDRRFDAEGACGAGIDSIAVLYGYGEPAELEESPFKAIARDAEQLKMLL